MNLALAKFVSKELLENPNKGTPIQVKSSYLLFITLFFISLSSFSFLSLVGLS